MSRVSFSGMRFSEWPQALPSLRKLDWKVGAVAALAIVALGVVFALARKSFMSQANLEPLTGEKTEPLVGKKKKPQFTLKNVTLEKLGFSSDILQRINQLSSEEASTFQNLTFKEVGNNFLKTLQKGKINRHQIMINGDNLRDIFKLLNFGMQGISYQEANPTQKEQSWIHMILQKLVDEGVIASFEVTYVETKTPYSFYVTPIITIQLR